MQFKNSNCESVGKNHKFNVITVYDISPPDHEFMISSIPRDSIYSQNWCEIVYECSVCNEMRWIQMPAEQAKEEKEKLDKHGSRVFF